MLLCVLVESMFGILQKFGGGGRTWLNCFLSGHTVHLPLSSAQWYQSLHVLTEATGSHYSKESEVGIHSECCVHFLAVS